MNILLTFLLMFGAKYGGEFMELGVDARALGMGGAYTALARGATAPFCNPAGILARNELFLMHSENFDGIVEYNAVSGSYNKNEQGIGLSLYQVGVDSIPITSDSTYIKAVNVSDWLFSLSYAKRMQEFLLGGNVKGIYRNMVVERGRAYGVGVDAGILYNLGEISLGLCLENITGTIILWDTGKREYIPAVIKTGIAFYKSILPLNGRLTLALGLDTNLEGKVSEIPIIQSDTHIGLEYCHHKSFSARCGLSRGNLSFGAGVAYKRLRIDYGRSFHPDLGVNSRLSGSLLF